MLHNPVIITWEDKDIDAVETVIMVMEENKEKDFVLMMKELTRASMEMKVARMIEKKLKKLLHMRYERSLCMDFPYAKNFS